MSAFPDFITQLPLLDLPLEGATGYLLQGDRQQVAFLDFTRDTVVPEHNHRAQWELVISGKVILNLGGKEHTYRTGQSFYIPAGENHGAVVYAGYRSIVIFDQVDRYRTK